MLTGVFACHGRAAEGGTPNGQAGLKKELQKMEATAPASSLRDVQCTISVQGTIIQLEPTNEGLAQVTYGLRAPASAGVFLEIYPGWSADPDGVRIPLSVGDVVRFEVTRKTDSVSLDQGVSVEGIKGSEHATVPNPRLRVAIAGKEIATVGAGAGGRLSQFMAFGDMHGKLAAWTHTTVTWPHSDGSGSVGRAHHWGAPYLAFGEPLTIEVLGPGLIDTPAQTENEQ